MSGFLINGPDGDDTRVTDECLGCAGTGHITQQDPKTGEPYDEPCAECDGEGYVEVGPDDRLP